MRVALCIFLLLVGNAIGVSMKNPVDDGNDITYEDQEQQTPAAPSSDILANGISNEQQQQQPPALNQNEGPPEISTEQQNSNAAPAAAGAVPAAPAVAAAATAPADSHTEHLAQEEGADAAAPSTNETQTVTPNTATPAEAAPAQVDCDKNPEGCQPAEIIVEHTVPPPPGPLPMADQKQYNQRPAIDRGFGDQGSLNPEMVA